MMVTFASFDEVREKLWRLPEPDQVSIDSSHAREQQLTKPTNSLGRLEDLTSWLCGWQRRHPPRAQRVRTLVFAGSHGVTARGISAYPAEVTAQMVTNFEAGGAAINQLSGLVNAEIDIVPILVDQPTGDFTTVPAMLELECLEAFNIGLSKLEFAHSDLVILGEMGIGNTTSAAAIGAALYGERGEAWAGPGTGLDSEGVQHKAAVINAGLEAHRDKLDDPFEILARFGGREIAALAGAILGARLASVPVMLDGFTVTMAAAVLQRINPDALAHCQVGHVSAEPAHRQLVQRLNKVPLLDLGMRLGEGSGAAVAALIVQAAVACHNGMATFAEAGVSR